MKSLLVAACLSTTGLAVASSANAQSIGIFLDPAGAHCSGVVHPNPIVTLYVIALPAGPVHHGISGCQFKITGIPASWNESNAFWQAEPSNALTFGHPFFERAGRVGVSIVFGTCRGDGIPAEDAIGPFLIGTIQLVLAPTPDDVHLRIAPYALTPTDPACAFFLDCVPPPGPGKHCASGGEAFLNNTGPDCNVAIRADSWSRVKQFYD